MYSNVYKQIFHKFPNRNVNFFLIYNHESNLTLFNASFPLDLYSIKYTTFYAFLDAWFPAKVLLETQKVCHFHHVCPRIETPFYDSTEPRESPLGIQVL